MVNVCKCRYIYRSSHGWYGQGKILPWMSTPTCHTVAQKRRSAIKAQPVRRPQVDNKNNVLLTMCAFFLGVIWDPLYERDCYLGVASRISNHQPKPPIYHWLNLWIFFVTSGKSAFLGEFLLEKVFLRYLKFDTNLFSKSRSLYNALDETHLFWWIYMNILYFRTAPSVKDSWSGCAPWI